MENKTELQIRVEKILGTDVTHWTLEKTLEALCEKIEFNKPTWMN